MAKSKAVEKAIEELTYEETLAELENIVAALEGDEKTLEEAMKLFERGQALVARCSTLLEGAQLKVEKLAGEAVIPFEEESE